VPIQCKIKTNLYKDSVALMRVAAAVQGMPGVRRATLMMATPANLEILAGAGLLLGDAHAARPSDLVMVVDADSEAAAAAALEQAGARLEGGGSIAAASGANGIAPRTIAMGLAELPEARLAQISVPGPYAAAEAMKALKRGLNVFIFSDNVPMAEERALKQLAERKGLLVMGPDCGSAIIGGVPLGFANAVRRGKIGVVAASGTGLQEITCQVHRLGQGVSHAIGTGGRDLHADVGGISMLRGMRLLARDPGTEVIAIVSKPPAPLVAQVVLDEAARCAKPVVVLFLGEASAKSQPGLHRTSTLLEAAQAAAALAAGRAPPAAPPAPDARAAEFAASLAPGQRYVRALFSGGTYCTEAQLILREAGIPAWSNVPADKSRALADPRHSREHTVVDLGSDEFTVGRPHPMIDFTLRAERLLAEAGDPEAAVILLDVVLGYGSHADPAGALVPTVREARLRAKSAGRAPLFIGFVCGTEEDAQILSRQKRALEAEGIVIAGSSSEAAALAAAVAAVVVKAPARTAPARQG
jgi:FdrA protein